MLGLIFLLILAVPVLELVVILRVADAIGFVETLLLLIAVSVVGAWLLRQQGTATWKRLNASLARGEVPTKEAIDGALIVVGGALLLTPGFVTDAVGLLLLFPVTRAALKGTARGILARAAGRRLKRAGIYTTTVVDSRGSVRRAEGTRESLVESAEDDSPDKE